MRLPTPLLRKNPNAHKGDFGHIFILAGSPCFSGAAVLCSLAALRSGSGLVTLGIPKGLNNPIIKIKPLEVMTLPLPETKSGELSLRSFDKIKKFLGKAKVLIMGPGLGTDRSTQSLVRKLVAGIDKPAVLDADALNALAGHLNVLLRTPNSELSTVLTPHPGEMARLLGISIREVQSERRKVARKFAKDYRVTVVLKGHHSIVAGCAGKLYMNKTGNAGMATAGSGDVLTGMIGAFLGQGCDAFHAAKYAVYLHGLAGDLAAKEKTQISLIASDIIDKIPEAIKICS